MNLLNFVSNIISPVSKLVDNVHTSKEEKMALDNAMMEIRNKAYSEAVEYQSKLLDAQSKIITAEAQGQSWLQRTWRPITMLTFLVLVVADSFGLLAFRLSSEAWLLLQIGLGGYVAGRSAEKIIPKITGGKK